MTNFADLGVCKDICDALKDQGIVEPTDIQAQCIPLIIKGIDVLGGAATGSGKTIAFGAGIVDYCKKENHVQAIVLTPTRELAEQVGNVLKSMTKYKKLDTAIIYGGVSMQNQIRALKKADIVVGTPGRVLDLIQRGDLILDKVEIAVLDECDRMLDMGFIEDVQRILNVCPHQRQTLFFSATLPPEIQDLSLEYMYEPEMVNISKHVDPSKLKQIFFSVDDKMKYSLLVHLLRKEEGKLAMVFCNSKRNVDFLQKNLQHEDIDAQAIHGGMAQNKRKRVLEKFLNGKVKVLLCTDVTARGIDIPDVTHVYNYDIPQDPKQYVHRIGRTARAEAEGIAINLVASRDHPYFDPVFREHGKYLLEEELPDFPRCRIHFTGKNHRGGQHQSSFPRRGGQGRPPQRGRSRRRI